MLRAAIVGIGTWGQNLVRSVQGSGRIRFVAGATRTPAKVEEFCRKHGITLSGSYEGLLESDVDAVVLTTPHSQHCSEILAAAKAGKHVFVEKPLGLSLEEARRAVAACVESKVTLVPLFLGYRSPGVREALLRSRAKEPYPETPSVVVDPDLEIDRDPGALSAGLYPVQHSVGIR